MARSAPPAARARREDAPVRSPLWEPWEKPLFWTALAAACLVLFYIAWPMILGLLYVFDDLGDMHIESRLFFARCLREGLDAAWTPHVWCGYYIQGEGQIGMYHPLHRFLYAALDFTSAFNIELFLSYPVMLAGMYRLLRRWRVRRDASMFAAMVFTLSGFNLLHFPHMHVIAIVAHMPWLLVAVDATLRAETSRRRALPLLSVAMLVASMNLLGHAQFVWLAGVAAVAYLCALFPLWRVRTLTLLLIAVLLGGAVAGVQLLPNYDSLIRSDRWFSSGYSKYSLELRPGNILQPVAPYVLQDRVIRDAAAAPLHEYAIYCGAVPLLLFAWLASCIPLMDPARRRLAIAMAVMAVLSFVITFGRHGFLYTLLTKVPIVGSFRGPARYVLLVQFAAAVLSGLAFEALARGSWHRRLWAPAAVVAASILAAVLALSGVLSRSSIAQFVSADNRMVLFGPVAFVLSALLIYAAARGPRLALAALVLATVADSAFYGVPYITRRPPMPLEAFIDTVRGLPEPPDFWRLEAWPTYDNLPLLKGYRVVTGYVGLTPMKALDYTRQAPLRLASCAYRIIKYDEEMPDGSKVGRLRLEWVPSPMPRARLVSNAVVSRNPAADLDSIDIASTALVARPIDLPPSAPGAATVTSDLPGRIEVSADAPAPQLLVISESYHDGWKASVNGAPSPVLRLYGDFLGVVVPKGPSSVALRFDPDSLRYGKTVSLVGLALTLVLVLACAFPPRPAPAGGSGCAARSLPSRPS